MRKKRLADFVIDNNGTPEHLQKQVNQVVAEILQLQKDREIGFYKINQRRK